MPNQAIPATRAAQKPATPRRLQFSLKSLCLAVLAVSCGLGIYIRMPFYIAGKRLDESRGSKDFPAWPVVRKALLDSAHFRGFVKRLESPGFLRVEGSEEFVPGSKSVMILVQAFHKEGESYFDEYYVNVVRQNGNWEVVQIHNEGDYCAAPTP